MADSTQSKSTTIVSSVDWGTNTPTVTYLDSPTRTVYTRTSQNAFTVTVYHPAGSNPLAQNHTGKKVTLTLCDGNWTIQTTDTP